MRVRASCLIIALSRMSSPASRVRRVRRRVVALTGDSRGDRQTLLAGLDAASRGYLNTYYRLLVMEFCEESSSYLARIRSAPPDALERAGSALLDLDATPHAKKQGEVLLMSPLKRAYPALIPDEGRRVLAKGDSVLVSRPKGYLDMPKGGGSFGASGSGRGLYASVDGLASRSFGSFTDLRVPLPGSAEAEEQAAATAAAGGTGQLAAMGEEMEEYEGEIMGTELDNTGLRVKVIGGGHKFIKGMGWRVDKLANRVTFKRQVEAIRLILNVDARDPANPKNIEKSATTDPSFRQILTAGFEDLAKADYVKKAAKQAREEAKQARTASSGGDRGGSESGEIASDDDSSCSRSEESEEEDEDTFYNHEAYEGYGAISMGEVPALCEERRHGSVVPRNFAAALNQDRIARSLNPSQRAALEAALTRRLSLIQGPPGTGKTHTSVAIVRGLLAMHTRPVLCTSDSNTAVDNLVEGLARVGGINVVRVGRSEAVRPELSRFVLEKMFQDKTGNDRNTAMQRVLRQADVVCSTCSGAGSDFLEKLNFPAVLLDEASQVTEPSSLVPVSKGCHQLILVGDHKQLPPTVMCRDASLAGLSTSLFDRLTNIGVKPYLLDVQFRMHPVVSRFPSDTFYGGKVRSGTPARERPAPSGFDWPLKGVPVAFVPVTGPAVRELRDASSYVNQAEAEAVMNVLHGLLLARELEPGAIGIVTPYAAQVRLIRRLLRQRGVPTGVDRVTGRPGVEVSSVDGYQGREKEVMIVSTVRSNDHGNLGFVSDARRCNVTLTRARRGVIVCGDPRTLCADREVWGRWLAWAGQGGLILGQPGTLEATERLRTMDADYVVATETPIATAWGGSRGYGHGCGTYGGEGGRVGLAAPPGPLLPQQREPQLFRGNQNTDFLASMQLPAGCVATPVNAAPTLRAATFTTQGQSPPGSYRRPPSPQEVPPPPPMHEVPPPPSW